MKILVEFETKTDDTEDVMDFCTDLKMAIRDFAHQFKLVPIKPDVRVQVSLSKD